MIRQPHDVGTDTESHEVAALMAGGMSQLDASRSVYDVGARVCDDCREPLDEDSCLHNVDRPFCREHIGNCAECVADLEDDYAAELSMERDR